MWIYLNNAFLSVVQHKDDPSLLHVRARKSGDIDTVFPDAVVTITPHGDYRYRTSVSREKMAVALLHAAHTINYTNFKSSIPHKDRARHSAYMGCWSAMLQWQGQEAPDVQISADF